MLIDAQETHNASWTVPRSIVGSFVCAGLLNLCLLLSYLFSVQHLGNLGWGVTQGLYPIGHLVWVRAPQRRSGAARNDHG